MSHEHACMCCHPERFPLPETRQGEHHVSVRFGDERNFWPRLDVLGEQGESLNAFEALAGRDGWYITFGRDSAGHAHNCPCHLHYLDTDHGLEDVCFTPFKGACLELRRGYVAIVQKVTA